MLPIVMLASAGWIHFGFVDGVSSGPPAAPRPLRPNMDAGPPQTGPPAMWAHRDQVAAANPGTMPHIHVNQYAIPPMAPFVMQQGLEGPGSSNPVSGNPNCPPMACMSATFMHLLTLSAAADPRHVIPCCPTPIIPNGQLPSLVPSSHLPATSYHDPLPNPYADPGLRAVLEPVSDVAQDGAVDDLSGCDDVLTLLLDLDDIPTPHTALCGIEDSRKVSENRAAEATAPKRRRKDRPMVDGITEHPPEMAAASYSGGSLQAMIADANQVMMDDVEQDSEHVDEAGEFDDQEWIRNALKDIRRDTSTGKLMCPYCTYTRDTRPVIRSHVLVHMPVKVRRHWCGTCRTGFLRRGDLRKHMKSKSHTAKDARQGTINLPTHLCDKQPLPE